MFKALHKLLLTTAAVALMLPGNGYGAALSRTDDGKSDRTVSTAGAKAGDRSSSDERRKSDDAKEDKSAGSKKTLDKDSGNQSKNPTSRPETIAGGAAIIVGERVLTGPMSTAEQRGSRLFLPVAGIARLLGDTITVDARGRAVEVKRQTGVNAVFSVPLKQVLEDGAVVLVVAEAADIVFPLNREELMLPVEIVSALLDVSVIVESGGRTVKVRRGQQRGEAREGASHGAFEFYRSEYSLNVGKYSSTLNYYSVLRSTGRIGDSRFDANTTIDGGGPQGQFVFRRGWFTLERPNGQRFVAGDFGTGTDMQFVGSLVRGLWAEAPYKSAQVKTFFGRSASDPLVIVEPEIPIGLPPGQEPTRTSSTDLRFDTTVLGSYVTFGQGIGKTTKTGTPLFSSGMMLFGGPDRSGKLAAGSVRYSGSRSQFQADLGWGAFSGMTPDHRMVNGTAAVAEFSGLLQVIPSFSVQGRYSHIGPNFLSPQAGGLFQPADLMSAGLNFRPTSWLGTSLNGLSRKQLNGSNERDQSVTASLNITPRHLPSLLITKIETRSSLSGPSSYLLANLTKELKRLRLFSNFTSIRIANPSSLLALSGVVPATTSLSVGASLRLNGENSLQISQFFGNAGTRGGSYDWFTSSILKKRLTLGIGFGYTKGQSATTFDGRIVSMVRLPREQMLQVSFTKSMFGDQLLVQLRGPLFTGKRAAVALSAPLGEISSYGAVYGKIYQDVNLNGRLDEAVDRPVGGVQVRVDGSYFAVTDSNGNFRVENIVAGEHKVSLDLETVRADLTLLESAQQVAVLRSGRDVVVDFRLVRTGRIRGLVFLDLNDNGTRDENEPPLVDVRVLTASGKDTLSDTNGEFLIGDLPPGEHTVLIDERTLPKDARSKHSSYIVMVEPGKETSGVRLPAAPKPIEVQIKTFPPASSPR